VRSVIEAVVESHDRAILLDVTPADETLRDRETFLADLFHPGEAGHRAWADAALPGLRAAFERLPAEDAAADRR
jgi:lysophospholipase L1-like esterase